MKERLFFPATERNRAPLLEVLRPFLADCKKVLEIASGSGEHLVHFAPHFPQIIFQPSDIEPSYLESIDAWREFGKHSNILPAKYLNCLGETSGLENFDAIFCINMIHISPPETLGGVMTVCENHLNAGGFLFFYGPFKINGQHTSASNVSFEEWLKEKDPRFSVRDMDDVVSAASKANLILEKQIPMPANNFSLVFRKN